MFAAQANLIHEPGCPWDPASPTIYFQASIGHSLPPCLCNAQRVANANAIRTVFNPLPASYPQPYMPPVSSFPPPLYALTPPPPSFPAPLLLAPFPPPPAHLHPANAITANNRPRTPIPPKKKSFSHVTIHGGRHSANIRPVIVDSRDSMHASTANVHAVSQTHLTAHTAQTQPRKIRVQHLAPAGQDRRK